MTPTLAGRWQSRFLLLGTLGMIISIGFAWLFQSAAPLIFLLVVALFGLAWDVLYDVLQKRRWDHDWPPSFQLLAGIIEGLFVFLLVVSVGQRHAFALPTMSQFWLHYTTVWLATFAASQSVMRLIFPRWRFHGGEWV
ncbi:MAG: hypothetical protein DWQ04_08760 [Chloroflexi bacterium]|nr:MAG: hypothetical protein DWQ04_08760 [Chloroflexota bacterium]